MKANAPEKLWWSEGAVWQTNPDSKRYIEYVRTDAFIEKACDFMRNNIDKQLTIYHDNTWRKRDKFIEAFRKFMKGEYFQKK